MQSFGDLEDPGIPITPEITEITGITNEMVAGKRIDDAQVVELVSGACIVIAHNLKFDRPFLEQRFPVFEALLRALHCEGEAMPDRHAWR